MVVAISKKRCGYYVHPSEQNDYNEASDAFLTLLMNAKTLYIQNLTLGDETPKVMWARWVSWYLNFPGVVTFSYDLHFRRVIARWKGVFEKYTLFCQTLTLSTI
jgi:hypothetical protein